MTQAIIIASVLFYSTGYIVNAYADKFAIMMVLVLFATTRREHVPRFSCGYLSTAIFLGLMLVVASVLNTNVSVAPVLGLFGTHQNGLLQTLMLLLLLTCPLDVGDVLEGVLCGAFLSAMYCLMQGLDIAWFLPYYSGTTRAYGTLGNPTFQGSLLALSIPIALHKRPWTLWAIVPALYLTGSRGGMIAGCVAVGLYYARARKEAMLIPLLALGSLSVIVGGSYAARDNGRWLCWDVALKEMRHKPLLGVGPASFYFSIKDHADMKEWRKTYLKNMQDHAHNDWLNMAATHGIPLALLYIGLIAYIGYWAMGQWPLFCALCAVFITSKVNPTCFTVQAICAMLAATVIPRSGKWSNKPFVIVAAICLFLSCYIIYNDLAIYFWSHSYAKIRAIGPAAALGLRY